MMLDCILTTSDYCIQNESKFSWQVLSVMRGTAAIISFNSGSQFHQPGRYVIRLNLLVTFSGCTKS